MPSPKDRRYTREHEWVLVEDGVGTVGITDYAQDQLGDIVYVKLPPVGTPVRQMEPFGEIESVKAVSDLFAPVSGEVVEVNAELEERPELVNLDPYGRGWMIRVRLSDPSETERLMTAEEYDAYVAQEAQA
ncbi:MAG TPA: glycine cleavage system protein GcvH [Dehalococcoidia bacterium]|nr:glycine cleavage system protein GcvH [Dehalococcoidia bacterium]